MEIRKRGPKTDNPKTYKITVKLDQKSKDILDNYSKQESASIAETVRQGIKRLKPDLKNRRSGVLPAKVTHHFLRPNNRQRQLRCKYYNMYRSTFQALLD